MARGECDAQMRTSKYDKYLYLLSQLRGFSLSLSWKREKSNVQSWSHRSAYANADADADACASMLVRLCVASGRIALYRKVAMMPSSEFGKQEDSRSSMKVGCIPF